MTNTTLSCSILYPKRILALVVLVLFSHTSQAQWLRLTGSIYDSENNQPIPYAHISVFNMPVGTMVKSYFKLGSSMLLKDNIPFLAKT